MTEISYKTIGGRNFMLISCEEKGRNIDTQIKMLISGGIKCVLPVTPTSKNGVSILQYDITGLTRLSSITQSGKLNQGQFVALIQGLISVVDECDSYALSVNGVSLDSDCIFFDSKYKNVKFAYIPTLETNSPEDKCREMLRSFIAYGKVEHDALTSTVTDVINNSLFNFFMLKDALKNFNNGSQITSTPLYTDKQSSSADVVVEQVVQQPYIPIKPPIVTTSPPITPIVQPAYIPSTPVNQIEKTNDALKLNSKRKIKIVAVVLASAGVFIGTCFTSVVRLQEGGIDITKILGISILIGALDFLVLRKIPSKILSEENKNNDSLENKKKKKKTNKKEKINPSSLPSIPITNPVPYATPTPHPTPVNNISNKSHMQPPVQKENAIIFASNQVPASNHVDARMLQPVYGSVNDICSNDTLVFDEPISTGELFLQMSSGEIISLYKSPFMIGRDSAVVDYSLKNEAVGRKHAEFVNNGDGWAIIDQNSRNHTYLNDICLSPYTPYTISSGDTVRLAKVSLLVKV